MPFGDLTGVRAIVTGASRGMGRAVAEAFADRGARVVVTARSLRALQPVCGRIESRGGWCRPVQGDLSHSDVAARVAARAIDALGGVDVLVNNAGVLGARTPLAEHPIRLWEEAVAVNLTGALALTQAVLRAMPDGSAIINVTSGAAGRPGWGAYAVTKLALDGVTAMLREELAGRRIRCVGINPGPARTAMRAAAHPDEDPATVPTPEQLTAPFVAVAAGADPGPHVEAREWTT